MGNAKNKIKRIYFSTISNSLFVAIPQLTPKKETKLSVFSKFLPNPPVIVNFSFILYLRFPTDL